MHDLQTIQFLNSQAEMNKRRDECLRADREADVRRSLRLGRDADTLHDDVLHALYTLCLGTGADVDAANHIYRQGVDALNRLHAFAKVGGK